MKSFTAPLRSRPTAADPTHADSVVEAPALTTRQGEILDFIRQAMRTTGAPPTREEIARAFGFRSPNAAEQHLQALQRKGLIELVAGTSRGIRLRDARVQQALDDLGRSFSESAGLVLPLVGKVAAGSPVLAQQNILATPAIDPGTFSPRADYLLEVRGMSMRDAGILDGDWLAVHRQAEARSGQVVVARVDDDVTVKRLRRKGQRIELLPENPDFPPIVVTDGQAFAIEGLAVGVVRCGL